MCCRGPAGIDTGPRLCHPGEADGLSASPPIVSLHAVPQPLPSHANLPRPRRNAAREATDRRTESFFAGRLLPILAIDRSIHHAAQYLLSLQSRSSRPTHELPSRYSNAGYPVATRPIRLCLFKFRRVPRFYSDLGSVHFRVVIFAGANFDREIRR